MDEQTPSPGEIALTISRWREGKPDTEGCRALLALFNEQARLIPTATNPVPAEVMSWLLDGIDAYLRGDQKTVHKALGLQRPAGRPEEDHQRRNWQICKEIVRLHKDHGYTLTDNSVDDGVLEKIGKRFYLSASQVKAIYYDPANQNVGQALLFLENEDASS